MFLTNFVTAVTILQWLIGTLTLSKSHFKTSGMF